MSESHLRYTVYFESRAKAAAWAAEAEATADMPLNEQARVLGTMLGLGEDSGVSFEFAGAAQLCAELAVLGPWNLLPTEDWPPGLLAHGANPNRARYHGGNALHEAVLYKATDCIPLLSQAGADRTQCDRQGRTPLQLAVVKRNKAAQKLLAD